MKQIRIIGNPDILIAIEKIKEYVQEYIVISNENILEKIDKKMTINYAYLQVGNGVIAKVEEIKCKYGKM